MHLKELRLAHCPIRSEVMHKMMIILNERSYLAALNLVGMGLKEKDTFDLLCKYISESKHLRKLDISYNQFGQQKGNA